VSSKDVEETAVAFLKLLSRHLTGETEAEEGGTFQAGHPNLLPKFEPRKSRMLKESSMYSWLWHHRISDPDNQLSVQKRHSEYEGKVIPGLN
jgi:hypothetical protein